MIEVCFCGWKGLWRQGGKRNVWKCPPNSPPTPYPVGRFPCTDFRIKRVLETFADICRIIGICSVIKRRRCQIASSAHCHVPFKGEEPVTSVCRLSDVCWPGSSLVFCAPTHKFMTETKPDQDAQTVFMLSKRHPMGGQPKLCVDWLSSWTIPTSVQCL